MSVDLFDLYTIVPDEAEPTKQVLVFKVENSQSDDFDVFTLPVEIAENGDAIIRIPADVWAIVPVETIDDCGDDCDEDDWDDDFDDTGYEDGADDVTANDHDFGGSD